MKYTRELVLTEIESCKRESVRQRLKKEYTLYAIVYGMMTVACLVLAYLSTIDFNGRGDPFQGGMCLAFAITLPIFLITYIAQWWQLWSEPTEAEKEKLGERIV